MLAVAAPTPWCGDVGGAQHGHQSSAEHGEDLGALCSPRFHRVAGARRAAPTIPPQWTARSRLTGRRVRGSERAALRPERGQRAVLLGGQPGPHGFGAGREIVARRYRWAFEHGSAEPSLRPPAQAAGSSRRVLLSLLREQGRAGPRPAAPGLRGRDRAARPGPEEWLLEEGLSGRKGCPAEGLSGGEAARKSPARKTAAGDAGVSARDAGVSPSGRRERAVPRPPAHLPITGASRDLDSGSSPDPGRSLDRVIALDGVPWSALPPQL